MFNLGLSEFAVIAVVAILMIGPKELPVVMAQLGRIVKRLSYIRFAVGQQVNRFLDDTGMNDIRDNVNFETNPFDLSQHDSGAVSPLDAHQRAIMPSAEDAAPTKKSTVTKTAAKSSTKKSTKKPAKTAVKKSATKKKSTATKTTKNTAAKAKTKTKKTTQKEDKA